MNLDLQSRILKVNEMVTVGTVGTVNILDSVMSMNILGVRSIQNIFRES